MRTKKGEKEKLRERILQETITGLKESGRSGAPVDQIMKRAGLTSGALYSHFASKDDLFEQAILRELRDRTETYRAFAEKGEAGLLAFVDWYLSPKHIQRMGEGCVFAALAPDMKRSGAKARAAFESQTDESIRVLSAGLEGFPKAGRVSAMRFIFASLIGALALARTMKSDVAAGAILGNTRQTLHRYITGGGRI